MKNIALFLFIMSLMSLHHIRPQFQFIGKLLGDVGETIEQKLLPTIMNVVSKDSITNFIKNQVSKTFMDYVGKPGWKYIGGVGKPIIGVDPEQRYKGQEAIAGTIYNEIYNKIVKQGTVSGTSIDVAAPSNIYYESTAKERCPNICRRHLFMKWNGQWSNGDSNQSVCGCVPTKETIEVAYARVKYADVIKNYARYAAYEQAHMTPQEKAEAAARVADQAKKEEEAQAKAVLEEKWKAYGSPSQLLGTKPIHVIASSPISSMAIAKAHCPGICHRTHAMAWLPKGQLTWPWGGQSYCTCMPTQETHDIAEQALLDKSDLYSNLPDVAGVAPYPE